MTRAPRVFVSAGEASGDAILGAVLERLRAAHPDLELAGLGGPAAAAQGLEPMFPLARTAFSGAWDVIANAAFGLGMYRAAFRELRRFKPDLALLVDYPGLNLRLAREARGMGIPVHFIAPPQAWAYRNPEAKLRRARAALEGCSVQPLFPFEAGDWPGHAALGHFHAPVPPGLPRKDLLLLCPGSRRAVLRRNLPAWLRLLRASGFPAGSPIALLAPPWLAAEAAALARAHAPERAASLAVRNDKESAMAEASRAIAFPGTLTLELALRGVPAFALAILDPLTYALGKRAVKSRSLALPNLILGEDLGPEWAGTAPGPDPGTFRALLAAAGDARAADRERERRLARLREIIGPAGGAEAAARECQSLLGSRLGSRVISVT